MQMGSHAWDPNASSTVATLTNGSTVYAGGNFTSIGGQARNRIAALDAATGAATAWDPNADDIALPGQQSKMVLLCTEKVYRYRRTKPGTALLPSMALPVRPLPGTPLQMVQFLQ